MSGPTLQNLHHRLLDKSIQHGRDAQWAHPSVRLRDLHPLHRLRSIGPTLQLLLEDWPVLFQVLRQLLNGHPVRSRTPFVGLDSFQCLLAVFPLADLFD